MVNFMIEPYSSNSRNGLCLHVPYGCWWVLVDLEESLSDILTTLSNKHNHVENANVLWNILNDQMEEVYFKKLRFGFQ